MTSMLDPEVKPSPAKEIVHKGKGCLAVIVAAAVLIFGGYFVWDKATGFVASLRRDRRTTPVRAAPTSPSTSPTAPRWT